MQTDLTVGRGTILSIIFKERVRKKTIYLNLKAKVVYVGRFLQAYDNFYRFGAQFETLPARTTARLATFLEMLQSEPQRKYEFM